MKTKNLLLTLALLLTASMGLSAQATFVAGGIKYKVTSATPATVEVIANTPIYSGSVTIPINVTQSGITYSVTGIGASAFDGCSGLTSIILPASLTSIGVGAFYQCSASITVAAANPNSLCSVSRTTLYASPVF